MGKYFGTDGVRGIANDGLDCQLAFKVGQAAAIVLTEAAHRKAVIYIGKDTRISSDMLEAALVAGVTASGADVVLLGVAPTPMVACLTAKHADAGIVISASHNSFEYNGIKIFNSDGYKLSDEMENRIEALVETDMPKKTGYEIGRVTHDNQAVEHYVGQIRKVKEGDWSKLKIAVDCANGASSRTARELFSSFDTKKLDILFDNPDGKNINDGCGSTVLEPLIKHVLEGGFDVGVAFDGDADRCLLVDEKGQEIDGDRIMAVCGMEEHRQGLLENNTIVATVMSNLGLHVWAKNNKIKLLTAPVGDRYVLEEMKKGGHTVGGEQSGHLIFLRHSTTGDGQLSAVKFLSALAKSGKTVSALTDEIPKYPQVLRNVTVRQDIKKILVGHPDMQQAIANAEAQLAWEGRILVRPSGTEDLVRVMVEGKNVDEIGVLADELVRVVIKINQEE